MSMQASFSSMQFLVWCGYYRLTTSMMLLDCYHSGDQ